MIIFTSPRRFFQFQGVISAVRGILARGIGAAFFSTCILAGCGGGGDGGALKPPAAPVPLPAPVVPTVHSGNWVVMGSSTAYGAGAPTGKGWADLINARWSASGAKVVNISNGGGTTYEALSATATSFPGRPRPNPATNIDNALSLKPVLLIVAYPTNDTATGYSIDETVRNLMAIRSQSLDSSVPVIVVSTQPRNLTPAQLSQLIDLDVHMAKNVGPCFVPVRAALAGPDGRLAPMYNSGDGIHPNESGHRLIADAIHAVINSGNCVRVVF